MKPHFALFLFCIAGIAAVAHAQPPQAPQPLSWYSGNVKIDIYPQPGLCVLPARDIRGGKQAQSGASVQSGYLGQQDDWHIYRADPNMASRSPNDNRCLPFYTSAPEWKNSTKIYAQAPGVLVVFKPNKTAAQISQWLKKEGLKGKQQSWDRAYLIEEVDGQEAVLLAERIFKSGAVEFAQPNWIEPVSTR